MNKSILLSTLLTLFLMVFGTIFSTADAQFLPDATQNFTGYSKMGDGTDRMISPDNFFILSASRNVRLNADDFGAYISDVSEDHGGITDWFEINVNPDSDLGSYELTDVFVGEYDYGVNVLRFEDVVISAYQGETLVTETAPYSSQSDGEETRYPIDYSVFEDKSIDRFRVTFTTKDGTPPDAFNLVEFTIQDADTEAPDPENQSPTVTTYAASSITATGVILSGNVTDDGGDPVYERGFVYATSSNPTTSDYKVQSGSGTGPFEEDITGLDSETTYFVRAYAINGEGTSYGDQESFTTTSLRTDITITSSASSGSGWVISDGELTATSSVSVNFQDIEGALDDGDLIILSTRDIIIDADIAPALSAERTLTLKADRDIILETNSSIAATGFALNTILWSAADASEGGMVYFKNQAEILTKGGHLWIGGGEDNTIWNGLTVGDGPSIGNTNNSNGVTLVNTNIQTDGGSIAFYGRGLPGDAAGVSIPISTGSSTNTNGIRMHDGNFFDAGAGTIYMYGFADNSHSTSNANGVELSQTAGAGDVITSSNSTDYAILIEGYAEGPASVSNSWGFYTHMSTIQNTGGGNIHIKGSAVKNSGVTVAGNGAVLANGGKIILEGIAAGDTNPNVLIQGAVGQKADSDVTSTDADIEIIGDRFSISGTAPDGSIQSSGGLVIRPYTGGTDIGIGSAAGTLQLPASYFNMNFADGFSEILVGDENSGLITVEGAIAYRDPLTLKTNGSIVFTSDADVSSAAANALTLWSRASGNNEADDAVSGTIWMPKGSSIHTGGGDLTMGGGSDPYVGYAKGDNSAPAGENNARYRGVAMNGTVNAAGGNIIINGRATNNATHARGVNIAGPVVTEGAGTITVRGIGVGSSDAIALGDSWFSPDAVGALETVTGDISLDGKPSGSTRNGLNVSTSGSYIKTNGNFSAATTGRLTATFGALNIGGNTSLEAVDNITFTHVDNDFDGNITVNGAANLQITDQNEMTLGGISVSGTIDIATLGGDLTITENISTTNATADAIKIFADKNKHAGDPSGGNIKISNTPVISTGTGGQARFYSGSILESADLITLTGEENTRHEVDSSTTVFDPELGSGSYALIREESDPLSINADLANLSLSEGTLLPGFDSGTISYSSEVAYQTESITITPITSDQMASVTVNGVAVASGNESSDVPLSAGANTITIEVTAEDGVTTLVYSIEVTRNHPFAGGEGTEANPYQIATAEQLDYVHDFLDDGFILTSDIDLGVSPWNDGEGWEPIGTDIDTFTGALDGNGHTISNLFIDRDAGYAGLFGYVGEGGLVTSVHIKNANVTSTETRVGILAGYLDGDVSKIAVSGIVSGNGRVGGLAGAAELNATITNVSADITIISADERAGGLLGSNRGDISNSYAYGSVTGSARVGGLVGNNHSGTVSNNYVAVEINGGGWTRGLVGDNAGGTYSGNFVDEDVANTASSGNGTFRSTGEMKTKSTFTDAGWNFDTVWQIDEPQNGSISYPYLQSNSYAPAPGLIEVQIPEVVTHTIIENITTGSAEVSGEVTDSGNLEITAAGFVWATDDAPGDTTKIYAGSGTDSFSKTITDLPPGTTLNVRAFAVNSAGIAYGDPVAFETLPGELHIAGTFTAQDKIYDGDNTAEINQNDLTLEDVYDGHDVSLTDIDLVFSDQNVNDGLEVSLNSVSLNGDDAGRYTLSFASVPTATADIAPRPITITADQKEVMYGEAGHALTYEITSGSLVTGDVLSGELSRAEGLDAGTYAIKQGSLTAGGNYEITYQAADFEITPRVLAVAAEAGQTKAYGEEGSAFTFAATNFGWSDDESVLTGSLDRQSGEDAGTYEITSGDLDAGANYTIDYTPADFTIKPKELLIVADSDQSRVYGEPDPEFTFEASGFVFADDEQILNGGLDRAPGEDTGIYPIGQGTLDAGDNYIIAFETADFEVEQRELIVKASTGQQKIYGEADPEFAFDAEGFVLGDDSSMLSGSLSRDTGEGVGSYSITAGNLDAGENYVISYEEATFQITPRELFVEADSGQQKMYGDDDPELTYTVENFAFDDDMSAFSGSILREEGESTGLYEINVGDLYAGGNYQIAFSGDDFEITGRTLTITAHQGQSKIYGSEDPIIEFSASGFVFGDDESILNGTLEREKGEDAGSFEILPGSLDAGKDYILAFDGASFEIEPALLTVRADDGQEKFIGDEDPEFTFTPEGFQFDDSPELLTGGLSREEGEEAGTYELQAGTLSAGANYVIDFEAATFQILMTAPVASSVSPADGETHIAVDEPLQVQFDQPVLENGLQIITLMGEHGQSVGIEAVIENDKLILHHKGLDNLTRYDVIVPAGALKNSDQIESEAVSWSFTTIIELPDRVVLTSPEDSTGSISLTPELHWEHVINGDMYHLQVSEGDLFDELLIDQSEISEPIFIFDSGLEMYKTYSWRVRSVNDAGVSEWSEVNKFTTIAAQPSTVFPMAEADNISTAPMLEWSSEYESSWRVQLSESAEFETIIADYLTEELRFQLAGLEDDGRYYWRIRVESGLTTSSWTDPVAFHTRFAPQQSDVNEPMVHSIEFGTTSNREQREISNHDYRMIGLPGGDQQRVDSFFEGRYGSDWKAFYETGKDTDYYVEYDQEDGRFVFGPGRGFWVLSTEVLGLELNINSVQANERDAYSVSLHSGWNIISNPHRGPVSWSDVQELNHIHGDAWGYNQQFLMADTLHPVQAYYYYNNPSNSREYLDIPYTSMEQRRSDSRGKEWMASSRSADPSIRIIADFGDTGHHHTDLLFPSADEEGDMEQVKDKLQRMYPSLEMSRSGMMLVDEGQLARGGFKRYVTNFEPEGAEHKLELKGEVGSRFNWQANFTDMPDQSAVLLVNPVNSQSWLLENGESIEASFTEPHTTFDLYTGDRYWLEQMQEELMPKEFALEPNYPNPFNPVTNIRYSLPEQQHVKLEVFDVIGRRIQVITNDVQQAGWHVVQFDGSRLASGVYLYRLTTDNSVKVRKMTLVK